MLIVFGLLVILNGLALSALLIVYKFPTNAALGFGVLACIFGSALVFAERLELIEFFKIAQLKIRAETNVAEIERQRQLAQEEVQGLKAKQDFSMLALRAQAGEIAAFNELSRISQLDSDLAPIAKRMVEEILDTSWQKASLDWKPILETDSKATLEELRKDYDEKGSNGRIAIQNKLFKAGNDSPPENIDFLVSLLDSETHLVAILHLIKELKTISNIGSPWEIQQDDQVRLKAWWKESREEYIAGIKDRQEAWRRFAEEQEKTQQMYQTHREGKDRIEQALMQKDFKHYSIYSLRLDRGPVDPTLYHVDFHERGFRLSGTEAEVLDRIKQAKTTNELDPKFK